MQTIYVPKYRLHYRVNPKDSTELQWSKKPFGPGTQWQHAMSFRKPIRALDIDDATQQGVVVLNDSSTYVGSGVRKWGRKFYPAGTRIFSLYAVGESKDTNMKKCSMQRAQESIRNSYEAKYGNVSIDDSLVQRLRNQATELDGLLKDIAKLMDAYGIEGSIKAYLSMDGDCVQVRANSVYYRANLDNGVLSNVTDDTDEFDIATFADYTELLVELNKEFKDFQ